MLSKLLIVAHARSILAAYDLGATSALLQKIYDAEAKSIEQWDLYALSRVGSDSAIGALEEVTTQNWTQFLGMGNAKSVIDTIDSLHEL